MWNLATAPMWSDLIHATLGRNDGFLYSFCNFSKSNTCGENFIRTKFILHKLFFWMRILSSRKTSCCSLIYVEKILKTHFMGGYDHFKEKKLSGDKKQYKLFCKKWGFEYFSYNNFSKRKTIFSKITMKNNFWEAWPFLREWGVG